MMKLPLNEMKFIAGASESNFFEVIGCLPKRMRSAEMRKLESFFDAVTVQAIMLRKTYPKLQNASHAFVKACRNGLWDLCYSHEEKASADV